jgi:hypothetical protein
VAETALPVPRAQVVDAAFDAAESAIAAERVGGENALD